MQDGDGGAVLALLLPQRAGVKVLRQGSVYLRLECDEREEVLVHARHLLEAVLADGGDEGLELFGDAEAELGDEAVVGRAGFDEHGGDGHLLSVGLEQDLERARDAQRTFDGQLVGIDLAAARDPFGELVLRQEVEYARCRSVFSTGDGELSRHARLGGHTGLAQPFRKHGHDEVEHDGLRFEELLLVVLHAGVPFEDQPFCSRV
mmetsp:Transcript_22307/g.62227  ORF Transcript_22307/g.62227 Transcript_22307/m.62227 type:complete len:205 (-) Transcript_22307:237-851(-)